MSNSFPFTNPSPGPGPGTRQDARTTPSAPPNGAAPQQPYAGPGPRPRSKVPALALGAYGAGVAGIVLAAVVLAMFLVYRGQTSAQLGQMKHQLRTTQTSLSRAQSKQALDYTHLQGAVTNLGNDVAPYNMVCSTDLSGANGQPGQFWFPCTGQKP